MGNGCWYSRGLEVGRRSKNGKWKMEKWNYAAREVSLSLGEVKMEKWKMEKMDDAPRRSFGSVPKQQMSEVSTPVIIKK